MKYVKLNHRWSAFPFFKFAVIPPSQHITVRNQENVYKFETARQWCVETWGDSPIFDVWWLSANVQGHFSENFSNNFSKLKNQYWSYDVSNRNGIHIMRLYFHSEKELAMYQLKWS